MKNKHKKCPVCKYHYLSGGLKTHIIGQAKEEVYTLYLYERGGCKQKTIPPKPHQDYLDDRVKILTVETKVWEI